VSDYFFSDEPVRQPKISIEIGSNETLTEGPSLLPKPFAR